MAGAKTDGVKIHAAGPLNTCKVEDILTRAQRRIAATHPREKDRTGDQGQHDG